MRCLLWLYGLVCLFPASGFGVPPTLPARATFQIPQATAPRLSLATHGWNNLDFAWPQLFRDAISTRVPAPAWNVSAFDWRSQAGNILTSAPHEALLAAPYVGEVLGQQIVDRGYTTVHLYGHSAGGELVATAANYIKRVAPNTTVQLTLLDPYTPGLIGLDDGLLADWADNYFTEDSGSILLPYLAWTDHPQPQAFNVDNSALDPPFEVGHTWEHDWYQDTITTLRPENQGFGFPLSLEAQGNKWNPAAQYQKGNVVALGGPGVTPYLRPTVSFRQSVSDFTALQIAEQSSTGAQVTSESLSFSNGGWLRIYIDAAQEVNSLRFTADFLSTTTAGLSAVYWNDEPVRFFEERLVRPGPTEYVIYLSEENAGRHELAVRLDGLGSAFAVSNVSLEFVTLREALIGDYDLDGGVDGNDFLHWQRALGTPTSTADGNGDGVVNRADLTVWRENFGAAAASAVPEPMSGALSAIGIVLLPTTALRRWSHR